MVVAAAANHSAPASEVRAAVVEEEDGDRARQRTRCRGCLDRLLRRRVRWEAHAPPALLEARVLKRPESTAQLCLGAGAVEPAALLDEDDHLAVQLRRAGWHGAVADDDRAEERGVDVAHDLRRGEKKGGVGRSKGMRAGERVGSRSAAGAEGGGEKAARTLSA